MEKIKQKKRAFIFGEGRNDADFLRNLISLEQFRHHTPEWGTIKALSSRLRPGSAPKVVLEECLKERGEATYDATICLIDLDVIKEQNPKRWKKEKDELEKRCLETHSIHIIWNEDCLEDEITSVAESRARRVRSFDKGRKNQWASKNINFFINTKIYNELLRILDSPETEE